MGIKGRKPKPRNREYRDRYHLTNRVARSLSVAKLDQLDSCADELARRILLGVSRRRESNA